MVDLLKSSKMLGLEATKTKSFRPAVLAMIAVKVLKSGLVAVTATTANGAQLGPWQMPRSSTVRKIKAKITSDSGMRYIELFASGSPEPLDDAQKIAQLSNSPLL